MNYNKVSNNKQRITYHNDMLLRCKLLTHVITKITRMYIKTCILYYYIFYVNFKSNELSKPQ